MDLFYEIDKKSISTWFIGLVIELSEFIIEKREEQLFVSIAIHKEILDNAWFYLVFPLTPERERNVAFILKSIDESPENEKVF